jgi:hypothetical protein
MAAENFVLTLGIVFTFAFMESEHSPVVRFIIGRLEGMKAAACERQTTRSTAPNILKFAIECFGVTKMTTEPIT